MSEEVRILSRYHTEHDASAAAIVRQLVDALVPFCEWFALLRNTVPDDWNDPHDEEMVGMVTQGDAALTAARTWLEQEAR